MTTKIENNRQTPGVMPEPSCVAMKRRGAEYVAAQIAGMTTQEQLSYWQRQTEEMITRQQPAQEKMV